MKKEKRITLILFVLYLIILTWIILFKLQFSLSSLDHIRNINFIPFAGSVVTNGKIDLDEIINNFILFLPVGVYLGMLKPDWTNFKKIILIFGISITYEIAQFIFALGATDVTDLIMNTLGGITGTVFVIGFLTLLLASGS